MKRRRLGQHYLVDDKVVAEILQLASIRPSERVLEIGTGKGVLTQKLAKLGGAFIGYEIDPENYEATSKAVSGSRAHIVLADAFRQDPEFDVLVASLPYSESAAFVKWLCSRAFARAIAVLQKDFVEKITTSPGGRDYRGVSALAQIAFEVRVLAKVGREAFDPQPRVDSVIASFVPRKMVTEEEAGNVMRLFSLRRREVDSALAELGMGRGVGYGKRRVFSLTPEEVHELCKPHHRQ
ncbi:MAG: methyltransferase domain-containing protein [Nitrososphaerota archaeon]|nr:methyltransferase domain-containing protein [Nitrososphaerota archaeon]